MMEQLYLKAVQINNFRNLQNAPIFLDGKINIFYGLNANGKTNVLEAIYYILKKRSFKKEVSFENLISIDSIDQTIKFSSLFADDLEDMSYSGKISPSLKESYLNGKKTNSKISLNPIFLNPYDSYLFFSSSSFRKKTIDYLVSEIFFEYKKELSKYSNILKQRNAALAQGQNKNVIRAIDEDYAKTLFQLSKFRFEAIAQIKEAFLITYKDIFKSENELNIELINSFSQFSVENLKKLLINSTEIDYKTGHSKINLNNEDLKISLDNNDFKFNSSFGQQKIAYISLILACTEIAELKNNVKQILLIDDLSNEIDHNKLTNLFKKLIESNKQVVITTANYKINEALKQFDGINYKEVKMGRILQ